MGQRGADVEAEITLTQTAEGGRQHPAFTGYRPQHRVLPDYLTTGHHEYPTRGFVAPGESGIVFISFITPEAYPHCLSVGQVIDVQEGSRVIGHARIVRILNPLLDRAAQQAAATDDGSSRR